MIHNHYFSAPVETGDLGLDDDIKPMFFLPGMLDMPEGYPNITSSPNTLVPNKNDSNQEDSPSIVVTDLQKTANFSKNHHFHSLTNSWGSRQLITIGFTSAVIIIMSIAMFVLVLWRKRTVQYYDNQGETEMNTFSGFHV